MWPTLHEKRKMASRRNRASRPQNVDLKQRRNFRYLKSLRGGETDYDRKEDQLDEIFRHIYFNLSRHLLHLLLVGKLQENDVWRSMFESVYGRRDFPQTTTVRIEGGRKVTFSNIGPMDLFVQGYDLRVTRVLHRVGLPQIYARIDLIGPDGQFLPSVGCFLRIQHFDDDGNPLEESTRIFDQDFSLLVANWESAGWWARSRFWLHTPRDNAPRERGAERLYDGVELSGHFVDSDHCVYVTNPPIHHHNRNQPNVTATYCVNMATTTRGGVGQNRPRAVPFRLALRWHRPALDKPDLYKEKAKEHVNMLANIDTGSNEGARSKRNMAKNYASPATEKSSGVDISTSVSVQRV